MWSFFSHRTLADSDILNGMTDYHSHILPGVDDGIPTWGEAIKTLKLYENFGIRNLWLTPHIMEDYPNRTETLRQQFSDFSRAYTLESGANSIALSLAAENMLDPLFLQRLDEDNMLPIIDGRHLLIETSYYNPPWGFDNLLMRITQKGYIPLLAHPERYRYMSMGNYKELHERGIKFQLDLTAVVGAYGEEIRKKALVLLKKGYYSIVGSDMHNFDSFVRWMNVPVKKSLLDALQLLINR